jgi:transposase
MTDKVRKNRKEFTPDQRLEHAKLMVGDKYTNQQDMDLSGAGATAVSRWKSQYLAEQRGKFVQGKVALDSDKRRIQALEKQLADSKRDLVLLKKATAFFIRDNPALK